MYNELKNRFAKVFKDENNEKEALNNAYADMSRRAQGHNEQLKNKCFAWLNENKIFEEVLNCKSQDEFDEWHKRVCIELKKIHGKFGSIGRSQKVINMAFKYLSCVSNKYDAILPFCHMTLDGYTLNWYKGIGGKWVAWSKIDDYDEYFEIQEYIRKYLKNNNEYSITIGKRKTKKLSISHVPFEAEFIIWEGEIIKSKYNGLIKELNNYKTKGKENDGWLIDDLIDNYLQSY